MPCLSRLLATGAGSRIEASWIDAFVSAQDLTPVAPLLRNLSWLMDSVSIGPMEKRVPHYRLQEILAIVSAQGLGVFSATAVFNAAAMGLSEIQTIAAVMSITRAMFYKSMTTHNDSRIWQDVYHISCAGGKIAYVKLTLQAGAVVIQFKEK